MTITVIDKRHSSVDVQADRLLAKIDKRYQARAEKNFVVGTLFKLLVTKRLASMLNARKLRDIMKSNLRWMTYWTKLGIVPVKLFFWEKNALNTPKYYPRNPKARRAEHRYCAGLVQMAIDADNR